MRFFLPKFLIYLSLGVAADVPTVDCSKYPLVDGLPIVGGDTIVYNGQLWQAQWWQNNLPTSASAPGWTYLGMCSSDEHSLCAFDAWNASTTYTISTNVVHNGGLWRNSWHAQAGLAPDVDQTNNWHRLRDCNGSDIPVVVPVVTLPSSTTRTNIPAEEPTTTIATTIATTSATTTTPVTTTSLRTTTRTVPPTTTTSKAAVTTSSKSGGNVAPTGPTGPNGECVWPAWTKQSYRTGTYVTVGNKVYTPKYWAAETDVPPAEPWTEVVTCTGQAPKSEWTKEELLAQIDPNGQRYQQILDPWTPLMPDDATIVQTESKLRSESEASKVVILNTVLNAEEVERIQPGRTENPANVRLVESIVTPQLFSQLFPVRTHEYTYVALLRAIGAFPAYCQVYQDGRDSDKICRKLLATSFAHFTQEVGANHGALFYKAAGHDAEHTNADSDAYFPTGQQLQKWQQALWFVREMGFTESTFADVYREACSIAGANRQWGLNFQCYDNTMYFGRGSKQLTHSYNYGLFSLAMFGDSSYLLKNPGLVADSWLNFASAVWFAVTPQNPKPAMIQVVDHSWVPNDVDKKNGMTNGFAATNDIINGGLECRGSNKQAIINRVEFYKQFSNLLGVPVPADEVVDCNGLGGFQAGSAGGVKTYLTRSWQSVECVLTTEQTAFRITTPGDYGRCVNWHFRSQWVDKMTGEIVASYGNEPGSRP